MGLLDKKSRILDLVFTKRGRELMSKNQLNVAYYAFSDDLIDYSGSLSLSLSLSGTSIDDIVNKYFIPVEANQMIKVKDFKSFLISTTDDKEEIPQFKINIPLSATLNRIYEDVSVQDFVKNELNNPENATDFVVTVDIDQISVADRERHYAEQQRAKMIQEKTLNKGNVTITIK